MKQLIEIQSKLKAPKGNFNSFGKYKYRSCEDILEAVKPLLVEQGCTLTLADDLQLVGERYYVKATATIKCGEESESVTAFARESESKKGMDDSQITGTASSYARKYALNGLFLIDDTKDADTDEYHKQTFKEKKPYMTDKPESKLEAMQFVGCLLNDTKKKQADVESYLKAPMEQWTDEQFTQVIEMLRGAIK